MRILSTIILALCLLLATDSTVSCQESASFISKEGQFTINFPDKPEQSEKDFSNSIVKGSVHSFNVTKNNISFAVTYTDYDSLDPKFTANKKLFIYSLTNSFIKSTNGQLLGAINTSFNNFAGRSLKVAVQDKVFFSRMYYVDDKKDRLYQVLIGVDKKEIQNNEETILSFLNSFKLIDSKEKVIDNKENNLLTNPDPSSPKKILPSNTNDSSTADPNTLSSSTQGLKQVAIIQKMKPRYTEQAREQGVEGIVLLSAVFRKDGTITDIKVLNSLAYGLDEEAVKAAAQIKFTPGQKDDKPVHVRARLEFTFSFF